MVVFHIKKLVGGIEFRRVRKKSIVQKADMYDRSGSVIFLPSLKPVIGAAQVADRTIQPVTVVYHLHFQIDEGMVIQNDVNIQTEFFVSSVPLIRLGDLRFPSTGKSVAQFCKLF